MKISAAARVAAPRDRVFEALNDPDVLRQCIPGCEALTRDEAAGPYQVRLKLGIAGLKGQYVGTATPENLDPPGSFTLAFDGKGKTGFVRGSAAIQIGDEDGAAQIACEADVQVGGAIAAVGSRLMVAVARKLTRDFFRQLATEIGAPPDDTPANAEEDLDQR